MKQTKYDAEQLRLIAKNSKLEYIQNKDFLNLKPMDIPENKQ